MDDEVLPPDGELKKRLFSSPSPENDSKATERDERERNKEKDASAVKRNNRRTGFRLSILGVMLFLVLCALALAITLNFNGNWRQITWEEVQEGAAQFFSNKPISGRGQRTHALFGFLGALPLATVIAASMGVFTCYFMYYDSNIPGDFPPTPVSPRKRTDPSPTEQRWHLGYMFVPVNALVAFILALFYLRQHMGLSLV